MSPDPKDVAHREQFAELDRQAWNLPRPQLAPVGPVREVWPVGDETKHSTDDHSRLDPAA
jgi:hypothetical protein